MELIFKTLHQNDKLMRLDVFKKELESVINVWGR
jgi:hypothetical protein